MTPGFVKGQHHLLENMCRKPYICGYHSLECKVLIPQKTDLFGVTYFGIFRVRINFLAADSKAFVGPNGGRWTVLCPW